MLIELDELRTRQSWPFSKKLATTQAKIMQVCKHTNWKIAVSFSGGKDSAVLLDQVALFWSLNKDKHGNKPLVVLFANTKNEFAGMIAYVKYYCQYISKKYNIEIDLRIAQGKQDFIYVIRNVGYPIGSKKISRQVRDIRNWMKISGVDQNEIESVFKKEKELRKNLTNKYIKEMTDNKQYGGDVNAIKKESYSKAKQEAAIWAANEFRFFEAPAGVVLYLTGIKQDDRPSFSWRLAEKWRPLLWAPFECSEECCGIIKKSPIRQIEEELQLSPVIGEMADDGNTRETAYLKTECNAFHGEKAKSKPMGFWLEQDVLTYIKIYNIPIFSIYGELIKLKNGTYKFTGEQRTGCKLCMFGIQFPDRKDQFQRLAKTEPNTVRMAMLDIEKGGLGYGKVIMYLNENCKCNINIEGLYEIAA